MTTRTKLANLGVSLTQAHDFVMANLDSPATIYQAARQHDINSQMLADIVSIDFPGLSASDVEAFFEGQGFSGSSLRSPQDGNPDNSQLAPTQFSLLSASFRPNERTGEMSNEAIRAKVVATTGLNSYKFAFAPFNFNGYEDGVFSDQDLSVSGLISFKATWENMESLWLGTVINLLEAIEESEAESLDAFITANEALLMNDDEATTTQLLSQILDTFNTPTQNPALTQAEIVDVIVDLNQAIVQLMGLTTEQPLLNTFISDIVGT